jgi:hypothetical protein
LLSFSPPKEQLSDFSCQFSMISVINHDRFVILAGYYQGTRG